MTHRSDKPTTSQTSLRNMLKIGTCTVGATAATAAATWFVQSQADPSTAEDRSADSITLDKKGTSTVILGAAGGPVVEQGCHGIASAVVVDGNAYLIDAGHGTVDQFKVAGILERENFAESSSPICIRTISPTCIRYRSCSTVAPVP